MTYATTDLVIIIPVFDRPWRVRPVYESAVTATPGARVLFVGTPGDTGEHEAVLETDADMLVIGVPRKAGDYARKINAGYRHTSEPLLFLGADDIEFRPGWFEAATAHLDRPGIEVVGTNDLGNGRVMAGTHSTHSLVTRHYCDWSGTADCPGTVLHEGYVHEYVDDEFVETAISRGAFSSATDAIVEHLHPYWGKAPVDALYAEARGRSRRSRVTYLARRHLWTQ